MHGSDMRTDPLSCSKTQPSVKASADRRLAGLDPHTVDWDRTFGTGQRMLNTLFQTSF